MLLRYGWTRTSLMWGDKMSIIGYPLQHGRPGLYFLSVTLPSGEVLRMGPKHEQP